jgi:hypothetical protein
MPRLLPPLLACAISASAFAAWNGDIADSIWALPAAHGNQRWLVIHNLDAAAAEGLYHVEVMERAAGAPPWQFRHLAKHMAVTGAALRASVIKPLKKGAVYPESFDAAYAEWKSQRGAPICRTTITECLK